MQYTLFLNTFTVIICILGEYKPLEEYKEAKKNTDKEVIITLPGPFTFLALAKPAKEAPKNFKPLTKLMDLVGAYVELLKIFQDAGIETV